MHQIRIIMSHFSVIANTGTDSDLYAKKKKSLSDLFSKQQSVWQFTAFIKHYMVEVYHRSALISQSLQQVPAVYMLR